LLPLLVEPKVIPDIEEHWSQVRDAPTGASLASLVSEMISLNRKQAIALSKESFPRCLAGPVTYVICLSDSKHFFILGMTIYPSPPPGLRVVPQECRDFLCRYSCGLAQSK
jgi:hypothetical protein